VSLIRYGGRVPEGWSSSLDERVGPDGDEVHGHRGVGGGGISTFWPVEALLEADIRIFLSICHQI
jgi:hypothetical protein